ncbi:MAG: hypothetical protein L0Z62_25815 [Gemmataceae bacterium]|nr:hypothetical protein [Gemmataceae bacterium]
MPRKRRGVEEQPRPTSGDLAERLADELRSNRPSGQPLIDEQEFPSGAIRVTVIWDDWDRLPLEDRTAVILRAYDLAEGRDYRERIALASGLTIPEAHAAGMLPFQIIPALRRDDPVTLEECRRDMIDEGASTLLGSEKPQLRFASEEEAEAGRRRLVERLPASEQVWVITQDVCQVEDWVQR